MKRDKLDVCFVELMPKILEDGILYVSQKYGTAIHNCACGCGWKVVTPIDKIHGWSIDIDGDIVTLSPSIGNYQIPCKTHYYIRKNNVVWL